MAQADEEVARLLDEVVARLSAEDDEEQLDALDELDALLEESFGEDGAQVGRAVRKGNGLNALAHMLCGDDSDVALQALHVIANLVSDAVDPSSTLTKDELLKLDRVGKAVLRLLDDKDADMVLLAAGTVQNVCSTVGWCRFVVHEGALPKLNKLLESEDDSSRARRYAAGALKNIIQAAHLDVDAGADEAAWEEVWLSEQVRGSCPRTSYYHQSVLHEPLLALPFLPRLGVLYSMLEARAARAPSEASTPPTLPAPDAGTQRRRASSLSGSRGGVCVRARLAAAGGGSACHVPGDARAAIGAATRTSRLGFERIGF